MTIAQPAEFLPGDHVRVKDDCGATAARLRGVEGVILRAAASEGHYYVRTTKDEEALVWSAFLEKR